MNDKEVIQRFNELCRKEAMSVVKQLEEQGEVGKYQARCAHLLVSYVRQHLPSGGEKGWWQCVQCEARFVASDTAAARAVVEDK